MAEETFPQQMSKIARLGTDHDHDARWMAVEPQLSIAATTIDPAADPIPHQARGAAREFR
jgi:hypothetical protein